MKTTTDRAMEGTIRIASDGSHGAIDFSTLTFTQLRRLLPPTAEQDIPTFKALREGGADVLVQARTEDEATITVFRNGFFSYETESGHVTVYGVDRCGRINLSSAGERDMTFGEECFGECHWVTVLDFVGNERIAENLGRNAERQEVFSIDVDESYWEAQLIVPPEFETRLEEESEKAQDLGFLESIKGILTARQWDVLYLYYVKGLTQEEIATRLGIKRIPVRKHLIAAQKKIQGLISR